MSIARPRFAIWLQFLEIALEITIGVWLLARIWPSKAAGVATLLFLAYAGISFWKAAVLGLANCGCFGAAITLSPWYSAAISLSCVGLLLAVKPAALKGLAPPSNPVRLAVASPFFISVAAWSTFLTMANWPALLEGGQGSQQIAQAKHVLLDPPAWVGKQFPLLSHIERGRMLAEGECLVVLYHHECHKCRELLAHIDGQLRQGAALRQPLALVQVPPYGFAPQINGAPPELLLQTYLSAGPVWHLQTPALLLLKDGQVVSIATEEDIFKLE